MPPDEERRTLLRAAPSLAAATLLASFTSHAVADESGRERKNVHRGNATNVQDLQVLFADLQPQLIQGSRTVAPEMLSAAAGALAKSARILGIPMTFAVVPVASQPGQLIPELVEYATPETTFSRVLASPFMEPRIVARLAANRRKTLVIAGFTAEVAVLQAAIDGIAAGYTVQVPLDAIGSRSERTEAPAIRQIELAGGVTSSVLSLVARWAPDFSRPPGSETIKAVLALS
ncbi:isochorismatase family protein [Acidovorax bellezanensis]|nr:isochorismatase family protein [Acidovorax sp. Be4]